MKLPYLIRSGLLLAVLVSATALQAQLTAVDFNRRGSIEREYGDFDAAMIDFTKAIVLDPQYAAAYNNRGNMKRMKGDLDGSLADFDKAIELKPDFANAYNNRGVTKRFKGDYLGATADFIKANQLDPQHVIGAINLASLKNQASHRLMTQELLKDIRKASRPDSSRWNPRDQDIDAALDANRPAFIGN